MSPLHLRRYRADRLLRTEFLALKGAVLGAARRRLSASGLSVDEADLEACYSQAWQGLYAMMLAGDEVHNPAGWLTIVTYRRAIDEHRGRKDAAELPEHAASDARDFAAEIDDRTRLTQLIEGLSARLTERERQAAALCYLQGLSREQAARRMGISPRRMQRLMEGSGPERPGVAAKVGQLTQSISQGRFCEEHGSLMRAFAFGVLDPEGERHRLALAHRRSCPACRAYVLSLRGLSAALPPVFLPGLLGDLDLGRDQRAGQQPRQSPGAVRRGIRRAVRRRVSDGITRLGSGGARLPSGGARLLSGGAGGMKAAVASIVLLGAGGAGVALLSTSSGAHSDAGARKGVRHASTTPTGQRPASSQLVAGGHGHGRHESHAATGHLRKAKAGSNTSRPAVPAAAREFGIERGDARGPQPGLALPAPSSAPQAARTQREFSLE